MQTSGKGNTAGGRSYGLCSCPGGADHHHNIITNAITITITNAITITITITITNAITITITIMVMFKVTYADYENRTTEAIADTIDCSIRKKPVIHD